MTPRPRPQPTPPTARFVAWNVLQEGEGGGEFVADLLDEAVDGLSPPDARLAWELALGAVRRRATLDAALTAFSRQPVEKIESGLKHLLRLGAYQLMYLDRVPAHAAVHETVEVARRAGHERWCGFANGMLRAIARALREGVVSETSRRAYPVSRERCREFDRDVFPDPHTDRIAHLATVWNLAPALLTRWNARYSPEDLTSILAACDAIPTLTLRVNRLRGEREEILATLAEAGIEASPGELPEAIRVAGRAVPRELQGLATGLFSIQDETPMHAAVWLDPQPGETLLDLCAAPGTKTAHLAERMQNRGRIVATDISPQRLGGIAENCRRLGIDIVEPRVISRSGDDLPDGPFDAILIDAPCSNTGVLHKRVEARWRFCERDLAELAETQRRLLSRAAERLRPVGRLLYSTCSLEPEENHEVVRWFLAAHPEFVLEREEKFLPGRPSDGGYLALLTTGG